MLPGLLLTSPANSGSDIDLTFTDTVSDTTNLTTYTFSGRAFGAADAARYVIVCVGGVRGGAMSLTSVTIGGVAGTQVAIATDVPAAQATAAIYIAAVPTGTTGDVVVVWSAGAAGCSISAYRAVGLASATATDTVTDTANPGIGVIDKATDGILVACAQSNGSVSTRMSWYGLTYRDVNADSDLNDIFSSAHDENAFPEPNYPVGATVNGTPTALAMCAAAWA